MKRRLYLSIACLVVVSASAVGYSFYKAHQKELQRLENEKVERARQEHEKRETEDKFILQIKEFSQTITKRVNDHNKQMIVVKESIKPYNYEKTEFATENYKFFSNEIIPLLHKSADAVISTFEEYDTKIKEQLKSAPPEILPRLRQEWTILRNTQMENYISHFKQQEKIVRAHQELLKFYAKNFLYFEYNPDTDLLEFDEPEMAAQEKALKEKISSLKQAPSTSKPQK